MQKTLDRAITDTVHSMQHYFETPGLALAARWPGSQWTGPRPRTARALNEGTFEGPDALWIDERAGGFAFWATVVPKKLGAGTFYLLVLRDSSGQLS